MIVKLLTERHLEFLSITGGCRGPSESTLVKMSNCWKSHVAAHIVNASWAMVLIGSILMRHEGSVSCADPETLSKHIYSTLFV